MRRTIRFHLDENCSQAIAEELRRRDVDVTTTPEVGLLGALDEEQVAYCRVEGRVVFSYDEDMLRLAAAGVEHAGIACCQQRKRGIGDVVGRLYSSGSGLSPMRWLGRSSTCRGSLLPVSCVPFVHRRLFVLSLCRSGRLSLD